MPVLPYRLSICGKSEVEEFALEAVTHLLSLEDPSAPKETPRWFTGVHRQLHFHDVESLEEARQLGATVVTLAQVSEILRIGEECLEANKKDPVHLLVHCFAGASRSPAAGYALVAQAWGPGREAEALEFLLDIRPQAFPNLLVTRYADRLLERNGELVRALMPLRESMSKAIDEWAAFVARESAEESGGS
jgi:predicted protein tyrosine phosphatase